jgi:hypothetical protein
MLARGADGAREARVEVAHSYSLASFQFRNITHEIEASDCTEQQSDISSGHENRVSKITG